MARAVKLSPIEEISRRAQASGMSYGQYVATHDTSDITSSKTKKKARSICKHCGCEIPPGPTGRKRCVCDECTIKVQEAARARQAEKLKERRCAGGL